MMTMMMMMSKNLLLHLHFQISSDHLFSDLMYTLAQNHNCSVPYEAHLTLALNGI